MGYSAGPPKEHLNKKQRQLPLGRDVWLSKAVFLNEEVTRKGFGGDKETESYAERKERSIDEYL